MGGRRGREGERGGGGEGEIEGSGGEEAILIYHSTSCLQHTRTCTIIIIPHL